MAKFDPRLFTSPDRLKAISPEYLIQLFTPWAPYFSARGLSLPQISSDSFPFESLSQILMTPTDNAPKDMVDALYYIDELSDLDFEEFRVVASKAGIELDPQQKLTTADLVTRIWLTDSGLLKHMHAEKKAFRQKRFIYHAGRAVEPTPFPEVSAAQLARIEAMLDDWFEDHGRGRGSSVMIFRRENHVWIMVRHGLPHQRIGTHGEDGSSGTELLRPQTHDILVYDEALNELGLSAGTKGERTLYAEALGLVLFGELTYFGESAKFTLEPLVTLGADSLLCDDIEGIDRIVLEEVSRYFGGPYGANDKKRAKDLFAHHGKDWLRNVGRTRLTSASFRVFFTGGTTKGRQVKLSMPNQGSYDRDEDGVLIEKWLAARGFIRVPLNEVDDEAGPVLDVA
jgi:hypothetical protein